MIGVWHPDLDFDKATRLWYTHVSKFALYLGFEGAKNMHILYVLILGLGGCWRFLTGFWHFDLDFDMITDL